MELKARVNSLTSRAEEYFYALSAVLDKEQAEIAAVKCLKVCIESEIDLHTNMIALCDNAIRHVGTYKGEFAEQFVKGALTANMSRKETHENSIKELKIDLECIVLALI